MGMRILRRARGIVGRLSLTRQVALLSLLPMVALGFILARVLQTQLVSRSLADATESARIVARVGVEPWLTPRDLSKGLTPAGVRALDRQLNTQSVRQDLARIKIWNAAHRVIYSEDHSIIGRTLAPSDDLLAALAGRPGDAQLVSPSHSNETASEVGLGELVEVYVPLRFNAAGPPAGAFEIYLSYQPIAAAVAADKRTIALVVALGLALLWAVLYRIVARASRRLRRQARENDRLARYDRLTGLPNRNLFIEELRGAVRRSRRRGGSVAVLLIDLDRFTEINNTLGSANGDEALQAVAARLEGIGQETFAARLGGDEYALLCREAVGVSGALRCAAAVQASLEAPFLVGEIALSIEASIGIAVTGEHGDDPDTLLQRADRALAHARSHGSRIEVYRREHDRFDSASLKLLGEVRGALQRGELLLHYQPKIDLRTRRITGVEALVRWNHPQLGMLEPGRFIPLVEQTALIGPLTMRVIDLAAEQAAAWRRRGIDLVMSVNLSARNLLDADLPAAIGAVLERRGVSAERLVVEVTESAAMADPERGVQVLRSLRESGVGVSIDDFGTGNASIEYLASLPASELKIDRAFITDILRDSRSEAIVRSTIDLARNLGLVAVAEGIETDDVLEHLAGLGCGMGQGYVISRPLPAAELTVQLAAAFGLGGFELRSSSDAVFARAH